MLPCLLSSDSAGRCASAPRASALRIAIEHAAARGAETLLIAGARLDLPTYDPAVDPDAAAEYVIDAVERADGVILASPSYHGGMTGLLKNALDHLEALRDRPLRTCATVRSA